MILLIISSTSEFTVVPEQQLELSLPFLKSDNSLTPTATLLMFIKFIGLTLSEVELPPTAPHPVSYTHLDVYKRQFQNH